MIYSTERWTSRRSRDIVGMKWISQDHSNASSSSKWNRDATTNVIRSQHPHLRFQPGAFDPLRMRSRVRIHEVSLMVDSKSQASIFGPFIRMDEGLRSEFTLNNWYQRFMVSFLDPDVWAVSTLHQVEDLRSIYSPTMVPLILPSFRESSWIGHEVTTVVVSYSFSTGLPTTESWNRGL